MNNPAWRVHIGVTAVLGAIALAGVLLVAVGVMLVQHDRAKLDLRDRRLVSIICAHVVADEAYTASVRAYQLDQARKDPSPERRALLAAIERKRAAVTGLDRDDCRT